MEYDFREYKFEIDNGKARITKVFWDNVAVEVPEKIEGYEVTEIGDYAFSRAIEDVVKLNFTTSPN